MRKLVQGREQKNPGDPEEIVSSSVPVMNSALCLAGAEDSTSNCASVPGKAAGAQSNTFPEGKIQPDTQF
jgi:hypothetical protein